MAINLNVNFTARGNFGQLARGLNQLGANIAASQQQIAQASRAAQNAMTGTVAATNQAAQASQTLRAQQVRLVQPMEQLATAVKKGNVSWQQFNAIRKNAAPIAAQQIALQNATIGTMRMLENGMISTTLTMRAQSAETASLAARLGILSRAAHAASASMINLGKNIQWGGRQLTVGLSVPLAFLGAAAYKAAMDVEREMVRLEKVYTTTTDNMAGELQELQAVMRTTSAESARLFGATSAQTTQVAADFASMGYTVETGLAGMVTETQRMQLLGEMELPDAINLVRSVQAAWQLDTEDLIDTMNRLNAVENRTPLLLRDIATAMPEVAAVANQMGISATFAAAGMAAMREGGLDAGEAAMAMRQLIVRMVDPTEAARERFNELGISLDALFAGAESGEEMILRLSQALGSLAPEEQIGALSKLVSVRQAARVQILMQSMQEGAEGVENSWTRAYGIIGEGAEELAEDAAYEARRVRESASGEAEILKAQIVNQFAEMGEPLMRVFNMARRFVLNVLEWFNSLSDSAQNLVLIIAGFVAIAGPIIMIGGVLINFIGSIIKAVSWLGKMAFSTKIVTAEERVLADMLSKGALTGDRFNAMLQRVNTSQIAVANSASMAAMQLQRSMNNQFSRNMRIADPGGVRARLGLPHGRGAEGIQGYIPAPDISQRAGRGTRAVRGAGAAVGLAATLSLIDDIRKGTVSWHESLMKVSVAAMGLQPIFSAVRARMAAMTAASAASATGIRAVGAALHAALGPVGWIAAAIGAIAGAVWLWNKNQKEAFEGIPRASAHAEKLAENLELARGSTEGFADAALTAEQKLAQLRLEYAELLEDITSLTPEQREQRAFEIGMELVWMGNDPEKVREDLHELFDDLNIEIPIGLTTEGFLNDADKARAIAKNLANELLEEQRGWMDMPGLQNSERALAEMQAKLISNAIRAGTKESLRDAGAMFDEFSRTVLASAESDQTKADTLKRMREEIESILNIDLTPVNLEDFQTTVRYGQSIITETDWAGYLAALGNVEVAFSDVERSGVLALNSYNNMVNGMVGKTAQGIEEMLRETRNEIIRLKREAGTIGADTRPGWSNVPGLRDLAIAEKEREVQRLEAELKDLERGMNSVGGAAAGAGDDIETFGDQVEDAGNRTQSLYNNLQSEMSNLYSSIADFAVETLTDRHQAEMNAWDARIEKVNEAHELEQKQLSKTHEAEMDSIESRYDARIRALEETMDTEKELDRLREYAFAREKRRRDWEQGRAQSSIDLQAAIARGDLDEAARIRQRQFADEQEYRHNEIEYTRKFEQEQREKAINFEIDQLEEAKKVEMERLEAEQDIAKERLKTEQDLQMKRLKIQKDAAQEANRIEERRLREQLRVWQQTLATEEGEYQGHLNDLAGIMRGFGVNTLTPIANRYEQIMQKRMTRGFDTAFEAAEKSLNETDKWRKAGEAAKEGIEAGLLGLEAARRRMAPLDVSGTISTNEPTRNHAGGYIGGRAGTAPGLAPDEVPSILQSGEYVIQRNAVKKLGVGFLESLNKYHGGGLIDTIDRWAPARVMGHVLGQVLGGTPLEDTGSTGRAIHTGLRSSQYSPLTGAMDYAMGLSDLQAPDRDGTWREASWKAGMDPNVVRKVAGILAAIPGGQTITSAFRRGAIVQGTNRASLHARGKAVDIHALARNMGGTLASERMGDRIAEAFRKAPGIREVLWKTWTGGNHFNHVHAGFYHKGGLAIPSLAKGAHVNYDNVMANLHRGETVLTSSLSDQLQQGISQFANGGGNRYDVTVKIEGDVNESNAKRLAREIRREIEQLENRSGPNRRVG